MQLSKKACATVVIALLGVACVKKPVTAPRAVVPETTAS